MKGNPSSVLFLGLLWRNALSGIRLGKLDWWNSALIHIRARTYLTSPSPPQPPSESERNAMPESASANSELEESALAAKISVAKALSKSLLQNQANDSKRKYSYATISIVSNAQISSILSDVSKPTSINLDSLIHRVLQTFEKSNPNSVAMLDPALYTPWAMWHLISGSKHARGRMAAVRVHHDFIASHKKASRAPDKRPGRVLPITATNISESTIEPADNLFENIPESFFEVDDEVVKILVNPSNLDSPPNLSIPNATHITHYWKLCRVISSLLIKSQKLHFALSIVQMGLRIFPLSARESIAVLIPFLAGLIANSPPQFILSRKQHSRYKRVERLANIEAFSILINTVKTIHTPLSLPSSSNSRNVSYAWLRTLPHPLNEIITSITIVHLMQSGAVISALSLFETAITSSQVLAKPFEYREILSKYLYGPVISALCRRNLVVEALAIIERGLSSQQQRNDSQAQQLFLEYVPDISTITPILESLIRAGQVSRAFEFLENLLSENPKRIIFDTIALQKLYWGCLRSFGWRNPARHTLNQKFNAEKFDDKKLEVQQVKKARILFLDGIEALRLYFDETEDLQNKVHNAILSYHVIEYPSKTSAETSLYSTLVEHPNVQLDTNVLRSLCNMYQEGSEQWQAIQVEINRIIKSSGEKNLDKKRKQIFSDGRGFDFEAGDIPFDFFSKAERELVAGGDGEFHHSLHDGVATSKSEMPNLKSPTNRLMSPSKTETSGLITVAQMSPEPSTASSLRLHNVALLSESGVSVARVAVSKITGAYAAVVPLNTLSSDTNGSSSSGSSAPPFANGRTNGAGSHIVVNSNGNNNGGNTAVNGNDENNDNVIDARGYLLLPGFVDAGIINLDFTLKKPTNTDLARVLKLAVAQGTTVAVCANFAPQNLDVSESTKLPLHIDFASVDMSNTLESRAFGSDVFLKLRLALDDQTRVANLSFAGQSTPISHASGPVGLSETPSVWPFLRQKTLEILASSPSDYESDDENSVVAQKLRGLLKSVSELACKQIGGAAIRRGVLEAGAIADFILIKVDDDWKQSTVGTLLPLFLSPSTPLNRIHAVFTAGNLAYTKDNTPIAHALASSTLEKFYITPNLPESSIRAASNESSKFNTILEAIEAIKRGEIVIVVDNEDRENEGDFIIAAEDATPEKIAFIIRYSGGVICVPMKGDRLDALKIPLMVEKNEDSLKTAYTVSVDYKHGTTTGISSFDRSKTLLALADPGTTATDFQRPGHVFPLRANDGGVLARVGHTEASIDLCVLAGKRPCAGISEVVLDNGGMARRDDLLEMGKRWNMCVVTIDALVRYRVENGV
ncbi:hypothetical protein HK100_008580 [Physocladia obscura]|uniref:3,4-dihydroxy-2-butanone-4-phosphate synthase n=1 Tax=Physocladia obscura TaxID=109957 RepID=A0AAD5XKI9_9FUNG|nr:hypothetical protein HK100_008580 [Physocladia obscura]